MATTTRYSDEDLALFKVRVNESLTKATNDLTYIEEQIQDTTDVMNEEGDWQDDSSNNNDLQMLQSMKRRYQKHIQDLETALIRIKNRIYGICIITGELINKRRLLAVPTTNKSVLAKNQLAENKTKAKVNNNLTKDQFEE